ncbi:DMT family transporter [Thalassomonas viridans]|uniref:DMT family transporter n=1 Tax=Thalassomonas viridans TaxID=137584 RepID=A0AAE9Z3R8_9GAMM|nr:DMT family transporter [Thalassomonas viridans]WDE06266.1 DMT family transporter [Thalassomonas viridans]
MYAFLWMLGAITSFCLLAIGGRELDSDLPITPMLFFRSLISLAVISLVLLLIREKSLISVKRLPLHGFRNLVHFAGQYCWFLAMSLLPLAEVFALEFTVPLWTALIAALVLKERITLRKSAAIILGISGVLVIVQPGAAMFEAGALIALAAAVCYALAHTAVKSLSSTEKPVAILFYMSLLQLPLALCFALPQWQWPHGIQWLWLTLMGVAALSAHYCISRAMLSAEVTTVVTLDFLRLPLIALLGGLLYQEAVGLSLFIGAALMLAGNLINLAKPAGQKPRQADTQQTPAPD